MIRGVGAALALTLLLAGSVAAADRDTALAVGERAPDVQLGDQHGRPFRLAEALGAHRFVVLAFYPKAFTGGWTREFSQFREDAAEYRALGADVVGISSDPPARNLAWARELGLPFRLLSDPDGAVGRRFGVWDGLWRIEQRTTFIVDAAGVVRYVEAGSAAIDTNGALDALRKLASAK